MPLDLKKLWSASLNAATWWPLSLAEKCQVTFGAAVIVVLALALLLPYVWMGQLTKKVLLDCGRAKAQMIQGRHFQLRQSGGSDLPMLADSGHLLDPNDRQIQWIRLGSENTGRLREVSDSQRKLIEAILDDPAKSDDVRLRKKDGVIQSDYVRVVRAGDGCVTCHNAQGLACGFSRNQPVGALVIRSPGADSEISRTVFMNRLWIIVAGLTGGIGATVAFYMITQRIILRPIRQLRAVANNVAEGNLDIRSAIKTGDEYEKLSDAFNHMLDALQAAQEKLRQANKQLDAKIVELSERNIDLFKANKVKGEFLANMSHEFRTPLNAILGFAEILREKAGMLPREKGLNYAEHIITAGKSLLGMINDLLDLAKTEAGRMKLHIEKVNLHELARSALASFSQMTRKKRIKVRLSVPENFGPLVTDAGKLRQILYNFLSNAVKFTPENGRIELAATMPTERTVRIAVSDTGCGIAEADREKIFEKFRQLDGSLTRETAGTGLGLAICKELAVLLAGFIGLESELGKGSTFWVEIPVAIAKQDQAQAPDSPGQTAAT